MTALLEASGVRLSRGDREVLRSVSLTVGAGELQTLDAQQVGHETALQRRSSLRARRESGRDMAR